MSLSVFTKHVNQSKNDIKDWVEKEFKEEELVKAVSVLTKKEMIDNLKKYLDEKSKSQDKNKEKKDEK
jgi:cell division protein FtsX